MSNDIIHEEVIKDPYGFIYITTNMINGMRYLGRHKFDKKWKEYLGSGTVFKRAVEKYGKENFVKDIIDIAYSEDELDKKEYEYSVFLNVVESENWYNLVYGGRTMTGWHPSEETREKLRQANLGHRHTEESKKKMSISRSGEKAAFYGKHLSEEAKEKLRQARIGKSTITENGRERLRKATGGCKNPRAIAIYSIEFNKIFWGAQEAHNIYGIVASHISSCCKGNLKSAGKHPETGECLHWLYAKDAIQQGYITQKDLDNYMKTL